MGPARPGDLTVLSDRARPVPSAAQSVPTCGRTGIARPNELRCLGGRRVGGLRLEKCRMKLPHRRQFLYSAAGAVALHSLSRRRAWALDYPTRPVRFISGFLAGGLVDITTRVMAEPVALPAEWTAPTTGLCRPIRRHRNRQPGRHPAIGRSDDGTAGSLLKLPDDKALAFVGGILP